MTTMHLIPNSYGVLLRDLAIREVNPCHEPGGSAKGGQFATKGTCASGSPLQTNDIVSASDLGKGGVAASKKIVTLEDGSKAVYKPEAGEAWQKSGWMNDDIPDAILVNPKFSQAAREAAAYEVDQLLGTDLVPETVLREVVTVAGSDDDDDDDDSEDADFGDDDDGGGGYGRDTLQAMYDDWRNDALEWVEVGDQMFEVYDEARRDFIGNVRGLAEGVITELWNEVVDENPDVLDPREQYGADIDEHPVLRDIGSMKPNGAYVGFNPKLVTKVLDPWDVIEAAEIGVDAIANDNKTSWSKREAIKTAIEQAYLRDGFSELGDLDEEKAGEQFTDYSDWIGDHPDTEQRFIDSAVASYTQWKAEQGFTTDSGGGGGGGGMTRLGKNAPHPKGGSLQRLVPDATGYGDGMTDDYATRFAILDYAIGQMDRHDGNYIYGRGATESSLRPWAIDNGMAFPRYNGVTFRSNPTGAFLDITDTTSAAQKQTFAATSKRIASADWDGFLGRQQGMSLEEKGAFRKRVASLGEALKSDDGLYRLWKDQSLMGR